MTVVIHDHVPFNSSTPVWATASNDSYSRRRHVHVWLYRVEAIRAWSSVLLSECFTDIWYIRMVGLHSALCEKRFRLRNKAKHKAVTSQFIPGIHIHHTVSDDLLLRALFYILRKLKRQRVSRDFQHDKQLPYKPHFIGFRLIIARRLCIARTMP